MSGSRLQLGMSMGSVEAHDSDNQTKNQGPQNQGPRLDLIVAGPGGRGVQVLNAAEVVKLRDFLHEWLQLPCPGCEWSPINCICMTARSPKAQ